jgi:hypothetical protein
MKRFIAYLWRMTTNKITPEELWARQQISPLDVDYDLWNERRASIQTFSQMSQSCIFTVDVFKERYDFASDNFATIFGYNPFAKSSKRELDKSCSSLLPCGAKPSALACYKNTL